MHHPLSPEQLGSIIDIAENAIVCTDERHRIIFFNQGAERVFGWTAEEVTGRDLALLLPERFRPGHAERVAGFAAGIDALGQQLRAGRLGQPVQFQRRATSPACRGTSRTP